MIKFRYILLIVLFHVLVVSCKKDTQSDNPGNPNDTITSKITVDKGTIGVVADVRSISKKGYHPVTVNIVFAGVNSGYSKLITVDQNTSTAVFRIPADSISEGQLSAFEKGVEATLTVYDESKIQLATIHLAKLAVDASNIPVEIATTLPLKRPLLKLSPDVPFIIQSGSSKWVFTIGDYGSGAGSGSLTSQDYMQSENDSQKFYLKPVEGEGDSTVVLVSYRGNLLKMNFTGELNESDQVYSDGGITDADKFVVRVDDAGWVKLRRKNGLFLIEKLIDFNFYQFVEGSNTSDITRFRLLIGDIVWTVSDKGTDYTQPLLPPAKLEFAYKATLRNCSAATLKETIGRTEERTQSFTSGTEESLSLFTSQEYSLQVTAGVDVNASFFGNGATYSFEATAGYTYTTSQTQTNTNYWESTQTNTIQISREREIQLGPYTAVEAYDAVQTINGVKLPFIKRFRVKGADIHGNAISGDEINFQLFSNQFEGVITEIGSDYVDVSVKGVTTIDKIMEVDTKVGELENGCGG